jgi:Tfp pilus assembly protein PilZ
MSAAHTDNESRAASLARSAREKLASALADLQSENAPQALLDVAGAVAKGMTLLHQFEDGGGPREASAALSAVRSALGALQKVQAAHPPAEGATAKVAASLGLMHSIGELSSLPQPAPAEPTRLGQATHFQGSPQSDADLTDTVNVGPKDRRARDKLARVINGMMMPGSPPPAPAEPERDPKRTREEPHPSPAALADAPPTRAANADGIPIVVALGAHSHSNFYRGLANGDVLNSGGLFVATYDLIPIGRQVTLNVSLPGGYEFEAIGVVRWSREVPPAASMIPEISPGFGVQFTSLPAAARKLVERYVRNRDPLLHDA